MIPGLFNINAGNKAETHQIGNNNEINSWKVKVILELIEKLLIIESLIKSFK